MTTRWPIQCPPGTYSAAGSRTCAKCEPGFKCPDGRASQKAACNSANGEYSNEGSVHCIVCPVGMSCRKAVASDVNYKLNEAVIEECPRGTYSAEGVSTCT